MTFLFTDKEFETAKYCDKLNLLCERCNVSFTSSKKFIKFELKHNRGRLKYCSKNCYDVTQTTKIVVNCKQCNKEFLKTKNQFIKFPNSFCSSTCSGTYNSAHKKFGTRRSKLEKWLEEKLIMCGYLLICVFCVKVQNYGYRPVSLLSRENRVAYIKREFTVYNKKVSHG